MPVDTPVKTPYGNFRQGDDIVVTLHDTGYFDDRRRVVNVHNTRARKSTGKAGPTIPGTFEGYDNNIMNVGVTAGMEGLDIGIYVPYYIDGDAIRSVIKQ